MSHSSCILSFDLIGEHQNKRFYVRETVFSLIVANVIFKRERRDDRKCVCGSQASILLWEYFISPPPPPPQLTDTLNSCTVRMHTVFF